MIAPKPTTPLTDKLLENTKLAYYNSLKELVSILKNPAPASQTSLSTLLSDLQFLANQGTKKDPQTRDEEIICDTSQIILNLLAGPPFQFSALIQNQEEARILLSQLHELMHDLCEEPETLNQTQRVQLDLCDQTHLAAKAFLDCNLEALRNYLPLMQFSALEVKRDPSLQALHSFTRDLFNCEISISDLVLDETYTQLLAYNAIAPTIKEYTDSGTRDRLKTDLLNHTQRVKERVAAGELDKNAIDQMLLCNRAVDLFFAGQFTLLENLLPLLDKVHPGPELARFYAMLEGLIPLEKIILEGKNADDDIKTVVHSIISDADRRRLLKELETLYQTARKSIAPLTLRY